MALRRRQVIGNAFPMQHVLICGIVDAVTDWSSTCGTCKLTGGNTQPAGESNPVSRPDVSFLVDFEWVSVPEPGRSWVEPLR
jgi:hypothetical protein